MRVTRRRFLAAVASTAAAPARAGSSLPKPRPGQGWTARSRRAGAPSSVGEAMARGELPGLLSPRDRPIARPFDWAAAGAALRARFPDLRRHFVFEYYPWYSSDPWYHWEGDHRNPPADIAASSMPRLGPYDSRSTAVLEQHARWIADSGVGAVNLSWWGQGDYTDRNVHRIMDVMRAFDIHVTFHLEPYANDRGRRYADDIVYLLREYGERRRWDCFLLLRNADGKVGPVFKSFRTVLPATGVDCHGVVYTVDDFTPDSLWQQQVTGVRRLLREDFDHVTLLADSLDFVRVRASGFDGIAIYDNYVRPETWPDFASACSNRDLIFSFNCNPGFDGIVARDVPPGSCYQPPVFEPPGWEIDWTRAAGRRLARQVAGWRIADSLQTTIRLQADSSLSNSRRGFFLAYVNSFNEWHEGHQFEPMKDYADLSASERTVGYHNTEDGGFRLSDLTRYLAPVVQR
jgi:hypothetical protein